jgi:zeaxanthin glucosyltransferase
MEMRRPNRQNVFIILLPEQGAFNASFMLARRLKERGIHVTYIGPPGFEQHVSRQGFDYVVLKVREISNDVVAGAKWLKWYRRLRFRYREAFYWYKDSLRALEERLDIDRPNLVLLDPIMWRLSPPILKSGIPIVGLNTALASTFDTKIVPVFSGIIPERDFFWWHRARNWLAWAVSAFRAYKHLWIEDLFTLVAFWLISRLGPQEYRRYRAKSLVRNNGGSFRWGEYGLRLVAPELVMAPREFDFPRVSSWTKRIYIGTCVDARRQDGEFSWDAIRQDKPLLYCSLGTYSHVYRHSKRLFFAVSEAARGDSKWQVVIQIGDSAPPEEFGTEAENLLIVKRLPQLEILKKASAFITHGGLSSVRESIYFGVPMIVFPCWLDQMGNAARIFHHQLGVRANIATVNEERIKDLLTLSQSDNIRVAMREMQDIFRRQEGCDSGADAVEGFLRGTREPCK